MSRKSRYQFIKKKYPNHIVLFHEQDKYITYDEDKKILKQFSKSNIVKKLKEKNINYIVFSNLTIIRKYEIENNQYTYYRKLAHMKEIIYNIVNQ